MNLSTLFLVVPLVLLFYTWLGYPLVLWGLSRWVKERLASGTSLPTVSIIVAAHNEGANISSKLNDCSALQYPSEKLEIIVASDRSTDGTDQIVEEYAARDPRIALLRNTGRGGKSTAQNLAAGQARGDILLFTDAETQTRPHLLQQIAEDFSDPTVGLVAPVVQFGRFDNSVSDGQGAYWRFEVFLRQMESDLGILATASGAAFAIRRGLFRPIPAEYGDDCIVPLDICLQGFRVLQDPSCIVSDDMPNSPHAELRARVRMTTRNWSGILCRPGVLNPFRFPGIAWGLVSHKLLRWLTPFFLVVLFLANAWLFYQRRAVLFFVLQCGFYLAALVGWRQSDRQGSARIFGYPFAFCLANIGFLLGVLKSFRGQRVFAYK